MILGSCNGYICLSSTLNSVYSLAVMDTLASPLRCILSILCCNGYIGLSSTSNYVYS